MVMKKAKIKKHYLTCLFYFNRAFIQHNKYPFTDTFIYTLLYLPSTTRFNESINKGAANTILTALVCCCRGFNPIMVEGYAALFSSTAVVQASDSTTASM